MFRPHFNIVFGGEGGVSRVSRALEGSILKLEIQRAFFASFLSQDCSSRLQFENR